MVDVCGMNGCTELALLRQKGLLQEAARLIGPWIYEHSCFCCTWRKRLNPLGRLLLRGSGTVCPAKFGDMWQPFGVSYTEPG